MNSKILALAYLTTLVASETAWAQGSFLQQMLRDLLESQQQRQSQRIEESVVVVPRGNDPARLGEVRQQLQAFSAEVNGLSSQLRREIRRDSSVAPYLVRTIRLKSRADLLARKYEKPQTRQVVITDLRELDREWRDLSYSLGQTVGLSSNCRNSLTKLDQICTACTRGYDITPRSNRREVARLVDMVEAELHHLERDIQFEVRDRNRARRLLMQVQQAEGLLRLVSEAALDGDPEPIVVDSFQRFLEVWRPLARQLNQVGDRHIDRTLTETRQLNRQLRTVLRIERRVDRQRLTVLANSVRDGVVSTCEALPMSVLLTRPDAGAILASAQATHNQAMALCECTAKQSTEAELLQHWRQIDTSWRNFQTVVQPLLPPPAVGPCRSVSGRLSEFGGYLGAQPTFDRQAVAHAAAELAAIAGEADRRLQLWRSRPGAQLDAGLIRQSKKLINACGSLHQRCLEGAPRSELAATYRTLGSQWVQLRPKLLMCNTVDKRVIRRLSDDISVQLVRLDGLLITPGR